MIHLPQTTEWILISIACFIAGTGWGMILLYIVRRFIAELDGGRRSRGGEQGSHLEEPAPSDLGRAGSSPLELGKLA